MLLVLVVITVLTLSAYAYTESMLTELKISQQVVSEAQSAAAAKSGIEYAAALLAVPAEPGTRNLYHDPSLFQGVQMTEGTIPAQRHRFTFVAPISSSVDAAGSASTSFRYGMIDESGRLNLNALNAMQLDDDQLELLFSEFPGMTPDIIAAIRDWIDADDEALSQGCESEYYEGLSPSYRCRNGPLESIDELLLIRGITRELLYGEDANLNGLLDPNENDEAAQAPFDNADNVLQTGWARLLTVNAREVNFRSDGNPRINVNNGILTDLYDELEDEFGEEVAKFVIAYRIAGPLDQEPADDGGSTGTGSSSTIAGRRQQQQKEVEGVTRAVAEAMFSSGGMVTRGGIDLSKGGTYKVNSLFELIGSRAEISIESKLTTLESPWPADAGSLPSTLPDLFDVLSTTDDEFLEGRININQAPREVLIGIPGMTAEIVERIVQAQQVGSEGMSADMVMRRSTTGWLFTDGLVDIWGMRELDRYLTARGDVQRVQVIGFAEARGPMVRLEALIDATQRPPAIVWVRDLTALGVGFPRNQLFIPQQ